MVDSGNQNPNPDPNTGVNQTANSQQPQAAANPNGNTANQNQNPRIILNPPSQAPKKISWGTKFMIGGLLVFIAIVIIATIFSFSGKRLDPVGVITSENTEMATTPSPTADPDDPSILAAEKITKDLKIGMQDREVKILQAKLLKLGLWTHPINDFFSDTLDAKVKEWQKGVGLKEAGIIAEAERNILNGGIAAIPGQGGEDCQDDKGGVTTVITKTVVDTKAVDALKAEQKKLEAELKKAQEEINKLKKQTPSSNPTSIPTLTPINPPASNVTVLIEKAQKTSDQGITWLNVIGSASGLQQGRFYKFILEMNGIRQSVWYDWQLGGMNGYTVQSPGSNISVRIIIKDMSSNAEYISLAYTVN